MSTFNFTEFKATKSKMNRNFTYSDLHLDFEEQVIPPKGLGSPTTGKDIKLDYDVAAIVNSLRNLFTTNPGERFLIPEFGLNMLQYIFSPVSKEYGEIIGQDIVNQINKWEPRVQVQNVDIVALPDVNEYDISIAIFLPTFKVYASLTSRATGNEGFIPVNF